MVFVPLLENFPVDDGCTNFRFRLFNCVIKSLVHGVRLYIYIYIFGPKNNIIDLNFQ